MLVCRTTSQTVSHVGPVWRYASCRLSRSGTGGCVGCVPQGCLRNPYSFDRCHNNHRSHFHAYGGNGVLLKANAASRDVRKVVQGRAPETLGLPLNYFHVELLCHNRLTCHVGRVVSAAIANQTLCHSTVANLTHLAPSLVTPAEMSSFHWWYRNMFESG